MSSQPSLSPCGPVYFQCIIAIVAIVEDLWWNATCVIRSLWIIQFNRRSWWRICWFYSLHLRGGSLSKGQNLSSSILRSKISWDNSKMPQNIVIFQEFPGCWFSDCFSCFGFLAMFQAVELFTKASEKEKMRNISETTFVGSHQTGWWSDDSLTVSQ